MKAYWCSESSRKSGRKAGRVFVAEKQSGKLIVNQRRLKEREKDV